MSLLFCLRADSESNSADLRVGKKNPAILHSKKAESLRRFARQELSHPEVGASCFRLTWSGDLWPPGRHSVEKTGVSWQLTFHPDLNRCPPDIPDHSGTLITEPDGRVMLKNAPICLLTTWTQQDWWSAETSLRLYEGRAERQRRHRWWVAIMTVAPPVKHKQAPSQIGPF